MSLFLKVITIIVEQWNEHETVIVLMKISKIKCKGDLYKEVFAY